MCSFYCPQQLLAPSLKLAFPDVPENYVAVSSCCSVSSERTCCFLRVQSCFSPLPFLGDFSSIKGVTDQASGFPEFPLV